MNKSLALLPLLLLAAVVGASTVPRPLDPVFVAPHVYEKVLENDRVRVLKQTIRAGETQPLHAHHDRVLVYLEPCAWLEPDGHGGERMQSFRLGDVDWADAETHGGGTPPVVAECRLLEIELLEAR
jgi:hypothetical protein